MASITCAEEGTSLLEEVVEIKGKSSGFCTRDGSVDLHGNPAIKNKTGNWGACYFILGYKCCEQLANYAISKNLVIYLTRKLRQGNVSAAQNVSYWSGTCFVTPLIGAILADAYWGRYRTIALFSIIYFFGLCILTISASVPALKPPECVDSVCPSATPAQYSVFFVGLYLIALGIGGINPCVSSFGADQFDDTNQAERVAKNSFFNWFFFSIDIGAFVSGTVLVYIQENVGWGIGFGIPSLVMGAAIGAFLLGTRQYRFQRPGCSPITRINQVIVSSFRKRGVPVPQDPSLLFETADNTSTIKGSRKIDHTNEFRCLDKASVVTESDVEPNPWRLCTVTQVEELKIFARMFPIWVTCIAHAAVYSQVVTLFIEQGTVMDTKLGSLTIPPASLSTFNGISVLCWVPIYDKIIAPLAWKLTGNERGFSDLQRIGIGMCISMLTMVTAAVVEIQRLRMAAEMGLIGENVAVPMSVLWQIPQYALVGVSEVFAGIGMMQFFYDQSPDAMRSLCSAWLLLTGGIGSYLSSFVLSFVTYWTTRNGSVGWIPDNLNEGHLDYYFWLLAFFGFANLAVYFHFSRSGMEKKTG